VNDNVQHSHAAKPATVSACTMIQTVPAVDGENHPTTTTARLSRAQMALAAITARTDTAAGRVATSPTTAP